MNTTISSHEAMDYARSRGYFARVTAGGLALAFYTGDELSPATWLEAGKTGMTADGRVTRNAVELICR